MFKQLFTIVRGVSYETTQTVTDQHAMTILRQQVRDSANAVNTARTAVAVAMAHQQREKVQHDQLVERIIDLEERIVDAMQQGKEDLAREAAESVAYLIDEREASQGAQDRFAQEIKRLRSVLKDSEMRLRQLQRGQKVADATDKTQHLRTVNPTCGLSTIQDAEETLLRLRTRQQEMDVTRDIMDEMEGEADPTNLAQKLSDAGCGKPLNSTTDEVLERLSKKIKKPKTS